MLSFDEGSDCPQCGTNISQDAWESFGECPVCGEPPPSEQHTCTSCGASFSLDEMIVVHGAEQLEFCPHCRAQQE